MKLFKNEVGRPSNEIKKKRKIFIAIICTAVLLVVVGTVYLLNGNTNKLKGSTTINALNKSIYGFEHVNMELINITDIKAYKYSSLKKNSFYKNKNGNYCKGSFILETASSAGNSGTAVGLIKIKMPSYSYTNKEYSNTQTEGSLKTDEFYGKHKIKMDYYVKANQTKTIVLEARSLNNGITVKNYYDVKFGKKCNGVSIKYKKTDYIASNSLSLNCPSSVKVNQEFTCSTNDIYSQVEFSTNGLAKGYSSKKEIGYLKDASLYGKSEKKQQVKAKYTKSGTVTVTLKKAGYKSITKTIKVGTQATTKKTNKVTTKKTSGQKTYSITFGIHSSCKNVMTLNNKSTVYNGSSFKIPNVNATYKNKNYTFKYWIIQRTNDGRYRVYNKDTGKYTWYRSSLDSKINFSYATFKPGELTSAYNAPLRLYAVCGKN